MNTTKSITPIDPQDQFILNFLIWLQKNYKQTGPDSYEYQYCMPEERKRITAAECLGLYRSQQIPPLPVLAGSAEHKILALAQEATRKNNALFGGYVKIQQLLQVSNSLTKQQLSDIILNTMSQIS